MSTQLQIVNKVLRRLREDKVTTVSATPYSKLIGDFLNEVLEEVGDDHNWSSDYHSVTVDATTPFTGPINLKLTEDYVTAGDTTHRSSPAIDRYRNVPILEYIPGLLLTGTKHLARGFVDAQDGIAAKTRNTSGQTNPEPSFFSYRKSSDGYVIEFVPHVDSAMWFITHWFTPQSELAIDGSDDSTVVRYNSRVMYLGALFLALNERGEELGEPGNVAEQNYQRAWSDAKYNDQFQSMITNRYEAVVD